MNELRVLAAGTRAKVLLLYQSEAERHTAIAGAERKIAKDTGTVNAPADDQNVELGFSKTVELLTARDGHLSASLESFDLLQKNLSRMHHLNRRPHARRYNLNLESSGYFLSLSSSV